MRGIFDLNPPQLVGEVASQSDDGGDLGIVLAPPPFDVCASNGPPPQQVGEDFS
jgi:hypothetical protein